MSGLVRNYGSGLTACLAALALAGASSTAAVASDSAYTVKVTVVKPNVPINNTFSVDVSGSSANTSQLLVFLNKTVKCKKTAAADKAIPTDALIIAKHVTGPYTATKSGTAHLLGVHYACAYLRSIPPPTPLLPRARAGFAYAVTTGT